MMKRFVIGAAATLLAATGGHADEVSGDLRPVPRPAQVSLEAAVAAAMTAHSDAVQAPSDIVMVNATSQPQTQGTLTVSILANAVPTPRRHQTLGPETSPRPVNRPEAVVLPELRWDHLPRGQRWTRAAMRALASHGGPIIDTVPRDIEAWCPGYEQGTRWERSAFWAGLLSTLAKHESTYRPDAVGGGGKWYGLVQILPATARGYGCQAGTGEALKDGALNMSCAVRILAVTVPRDNVVSEGMRGVAADWGPFHSRRKREDMRAWTRAQPWCEKDESSIRPVPRPDRPAPAGTVVQAPVVQDDAISLARLTAQVHATLGAETEAPVPEVATRSAGAPVRPLARPVQAPATEVETSTRPALRPRGGVISVLDQLD